MRPTAAQNSPASQSPVPNLGRDGTLNVADKQFVIKAAQSDMTEIQTSQLALKRAQSPSVKQFAQEMIQQHTESSNKLKPLAVQKGITLPKSLGTEGQKMLTQLTKLSGKQFDKAYLSGQAEGHTNTQALYRYELKQGTDTEVKAFANEILPIVTSHLQEVQSLAMGNKN